MGCFHPAILLIRQEIKGKRNPAFPEIIVMISSWYFRYLKNFGFLILRISLNYFKKFLFIILNLNLKFSNNL